MSGVEVTKNIFGTLRVGYDCPHCKERLRSPLKDAGTVDSCPNYHVQFTVPGTDALKREQRRQHAEQEQKEAERHRKAQQLEQEREQKHQEQLGLAAEKRVDDEKRRQLELEEASRIQPDAIDSEPSPAAPGENQKSRRSIVYGIAGIVGFLLLSMIYSASTNSGAGITDVVRSAGLCTKLKRCPTYGIVDADVYYDGTIATDVVVFDLLDGGSTTARRIDPVHLLMQFCDEIDLYSVRRIIIARNGTQKFYISGSDMRPLAESYANGGRPWAFNHLPENLRTMSGLRAYDQWTGGWLGVLQKQTEDLNDFLAAWLNNSLSASNLFGNVDIGMNRPAYTREQVRDTLRQMENNVPDTLREMEDNLPGYGRRSPTETMRSISTLKSACYVIAKRLNAPQRYVRFATTPQHDGSPHIESNGNEFAYVITERGMEHERRKTTNADDVLYWLVGDLTREMASEYELSHRIPTADSRRMLFQKHVEFLSAINHDWASRKESEYEAVLEKHPFHDKMGEQSGEREQNL